MMRMLMREILPGRRTIRSRFMRRPFFFSSDFFLFFRSYKAANAVRMGVHYGNGGLIMWVFSGWIYPPGVWKEAILLVDHLIVVPFHVMISSFSFTLGQ